MPLILHTAAYWLMLTVRDAIPKAHVLASAEFATIRLRLLKLAARVIETASRIRDGFLSTSISGASLCDRQSGADLRFNPPPNRIWPPVKNVRVDPV